MERKLLPKSPILQCRQRRIDMLRRLAPVQHNGLDFKTIPSSSSSGQSPMMFSRFFLALVCPLALTRASPPPNAEDQTIPSPKDSPLPASTSRDGIDVPLNASNGLRIQCDGEKYGFNPKVADCQNAREYYTRSSKLNTYGQRHSGYGVNVFPLPFRTMGGTLLKPLRFLTGFSTPKCCAKT